MSQNAEPEGGRARAVEVYKLWWQHDAHWYQGVAARFGQEAANEINAEALRRVAVQVGQRVGRRAGPLPGTGNGGDGEGVRDLPSGSPAPRGETGDQGDPASRGGGAVDGKALDELRRRYDECGERMFPRELRNASTEVAGDDLIVLTLRRNFAVTMLRMAGSLEGYRCPCTDIHAGWSEGLGVTLTENRAECCLREGAAACRLLLRVGAPVVPVPGEEG